MTLVAQFVMALSCFLMPSLALATSSTVPQEVNKCFSRPVSGFGKSEAFLKAPQQICVNKVTVSPVVKTSGSLSYYKYVEVSLELATDDNFGHEKVIQIESSAVSEYGQPFKSSTFFGAIGAGTKELYQQRSPDGDTESCDSIDSLTSILQFSLDEKFQLVDSSATLKSRYSFTTDSCNSPGVEEELEYDVNPRK